MNMSVEVRPNPVSRYFINLECHQREKKKCTQVVLKIMSSITPLLS
jgi:hypothetical protein